MPDLDIQGNIRPIPSGSNPDLGAFENPLSSPVEHIVIESDTLLVQEDSSASVHLKDNDLILNIANVVLTILDSSNHGNISILGDSLLTYTPEPNFFGYDTIEYTLNGTTANDSGFIYITILNEDDLPVVVNAIPDLTVNEDALDTMLVDLDLVFMDIDDALEYSHAVGDTTLVFAQVNSDSVTLQFLPDANGGTEIIFTATNPTIRASVSDTMILTVLPINDAPVALADTVTTDEDSEHSGILAASDLDGDTLTFSVLTNPTYGTLSLGGDSYTYSPAENYNGSDSFTFIASDSALSDTAMVSITVIAINDFPVMATIADTIINEDNILEILLLATDIDEDTLTFSATADTSAVIPTVSEDTLSLSTSDNWNGSSIILVMVSDETGTDTTSFQLIVNAINDAPSTFALNEQDSVYIGMENVASDSISFSWEESLDIDDGDELSYEFSASLLINGQVTEEYSIEGFMENEFKIDYQSVFDAIFAAETMDAGIEWNVSVTDGEEEVISENGPLTLGVNASDAVLSIYDALLPDEFALHQNYPNPFNPVTTLRYDLPENGLVNITIYDMLGRQVKTLVYQTQEAGYRSIVWNATNDYGKPVSAGIYLYQIQAGKYISTKKMVLLK